VPSKKSARYGSLAEQKAAEKYRLRRDGVHTSWCDAVDSDGRPVEIKATDAAREYPRFKIYEKYHDRLQSNNGHYVFVLYRKCGRGIVVADIRRRHASRLPTLTWHKTGGHRDTPHESKVKPSEVL
jgi:hypothetical protein